MQAKSITEEQLTTQYYCKDVPPSLHSFVSSCSYVWELIEKHDQLIDSQKKKTISSDAHINKSVDISGNVHIGKGTVVDSYVRIEGPVYIGDHVKIEHGALIRPGSYLENHSAVGHGSEIKRSLLFPYAKVSSLSFVGDSVLGTHARVASGAIVSNRRFDQKEIVIRNTIQEHNTNMKHFGMVIGEHSRLGANAIANPGSFIGSFTFIAGSITIVGFVPSHSYVEAKQINTIVRNRHSKPLREHGM